MLNAKLCFTLFLLHVVIAFNPRAYSKKFAGCKSINRAKNNTNVDITYVDINSSAKKPLLMVHGWPSLWSTWSNQIEELKNDYHLIIPDLRGFGESTHPGDVESSGTMFDIVGDLTCVLEHAKVESAICIGHDWGSQACYEAARSRPDIFKAVVGAVVPYIPSDGPYVPIKHIVPKLPKLAYQLFFSENTSAAVEELDTNIRRTIRATLRTVDSPPPDEFLTSPFTFLGGWDGIDGIPEVPFFTSNEEDYFVEQYHNQGFKYTLQFYTNSNRHASWELAHSQGNYTISQPALSILPLNDPVADWHAAAEILGSSKFLPRLTTESLTGAHWVHLENPEAFNAILRTWLDETSKEWGGRPLDEL